MPKPVPGCMTVCSESPCMYQKLGKYSSTGTVQQQSVLDDAIEPQPMASANVSRLSTDDTPVVQTMQKLFGDLHTSCVSCRNQGELMEKRLQSQLSAMEKKLEHILVAMGVPGITEEVYISRIDSFSCLDAQQQSLPKKTGQLDEVESPANGVASQEHEPKLIPAFTEDDPKPWRKKRTNPLRASVEQAVSTGTRGQALLKQPDICEVIVANPKFDAFCALAVVANSLLVGMLINHEAVSDDSPSFYLNLEYVFTGWFTLELIIRVLGRKRAFFAKDEVHWAVFDVVLVIVSYVDIGMEIGFKSTGGLPGPGASMGKILKIARVARILRILRMVHFLTNVRIMVTLILGSLVSLFWLLVLLVFVMYMFAIVLTQGATIWLKPGSEFTAPTSDPKFSDVRRYYGSVPKTMYTLFMSMTGGVSWGEPGDISQAYGWVYFMVFIFYIFFTIFSVMNIVTGVFVDGAIQQAENDRSLMVEKQLQLKKELHDALTDILAQLDADGDGCLSKDEWIQVFCDKTIVATLSGLQVNIQEAEDLWDMLDVDGDGAVDIVEFVDGMLRLKGYAKAIDVERLLSRVNKVLAYTHALCKKARLLESDMSTGGRHIDLLT